MAGFDACYSRNEDDCSKRTSFTGAGILFNMYIIIYIYMFYSMSIDGFQKRKTCVLKHLSLHGALQAQSEVLLTECEMWGRFARCMRALFYFDIHRILIASETDFFTLLIALVWHHMNFFRVLTLIIFLLIKQMEACVKLSDALYHCIIASQQYLEVHVAVTYGHFTRSF